MRIKGLAQGPVQINFKALLKDVEFNYPGNPVDQVQIRRMMFAMAEDVTDYMKPKTWRSKELYMVQISAPGILQWSQFATDFLEAALDPVGKELWSGN